MDYTHLPEKNMFEMSFLMVTSFLKLTYKSVIPVTNLEMTNKRTVEHYIRALKYLSFERRPRPYYELSVQYIRQLMF